MSKKTKYEEQVEVIKEASKDAQASKQASINFLVMAGILRPRKEKI